MIKKGKAVVCIVGLGYVGLPLAEAFAKHLKAIGYHIDEEKIKNLNSIKIIGHKNNRSSPHFVGLQK